ncbi:uncharacterized protein FIBRA_05672 [Fibroporia radiculosa]|uniref:Uncharacterized protein n=1 Tax=Fibroporia radiculosa TaxID=599839 RepID=J4G9X2_9APHY|nr:uncharacterized protein FIBRA_05672 [Fibroporia radiculosa]CCM03538.1 predicted protein [Fibroporia radiculosa]
MDESHNPSIAKDTPTLTTLITPSTSPPSSRTYTKSHSRSLDRASSTKRSRLASTPSRSSTLSCTSSSTAYTVDEVLESRKTSDQKLVAFWAQLGERYNRPLAEDDIIDLRDGSIVKDRGILRGLSKKYVGYFGGDQPSSDLNDVNSDAGGAQTDDDADELDAFAPEEDISNELKLEREKLQHSRARNVDPAAAEDLREFLAAEERRKALYGSLDDDEASDGNPPANEDHNSPDAENFKEHFEEYEERLKSSEDDAVNSIPVAGHIRRRSVRPARTPANPLRITGDESDDEFAAWACNESSPVKRSNPLPNSSDDIIDLTDSPPSSPLPPPIPVRRARSRHSYDRRNRSSPPPKPLTPSRSGSLSRASSEAPVRQQVAVLHSIPSASMNRQLVTPPLSSSSILDGSPDLMRPTVPRISPSLSPSPPPPPLRPRPRPLYKGSNSSSEHAVTNVEANHLLPSTDLPDLPPSNPLKALTLPSKPRLIPEVVVTLKPRNTASGASTRPSLRDVAGLNDSGHSSINSTSLQKDKGKKVFSQLDAAEAEESENKTNDTPTGLSASNSIGVKKTPPQEDMQSRINSAPSVKGRKRKRVISSSSVSGQSVQEGYSSNLASNSLPHKERASSSGRSSHRRMAEYERSDDESDNSDHHDKASFDTRSRTTLVPPPIPFSSYLPHMPFPLQHNPHTHFTPMGHDAQVEARIAQSVLSFLWNAAAGLPPGSGHAIPYPSFSPQTMQWPPQTPHKRRKSRHRMQSEVPSSDGAGPSMPSSMYSTPSHPHPYPYSYDPSFSRATLPPSSPPESLRSSSPAPAERSRSQSKARGRRVSFKLDDDDRQSSPTDRGTKQRRGRTPGPLS